MLLYLFLLYGVRNTTYQADGTRSGNTCMRVAMLATQHQADCKRSRKYMHGKGFVGLN